MRESGLDVAFDHGSHLIRRPREIVVEEDAAGLHSVAVVDHDGARQLVRMKSRCCCLRRMRRQRRVNAAALLLRPEQEPALLELRSSRVVGPGADDLGAEEQPPCRDRLDWNR